MNGSQYAPAATAGGQSATSTGPPTCQNCSTSTTPLWRRDESGAVLCNACGLFLKLHGRPRPISLKTDVIKSRNRVKGGVQAQNARRREGEEGGNGGRATGSLAAAHPDVAAHSGTQQPAPQQQQHVPPFSAGDGQQRRPSEAEMVERSRTRTPNPYPSHNNQVLQHPHPHPHHAQHAQQRRGSDRDPNIAPQHIFDTVSLTVGDDYPPTTYRVPSPSNVSQLDAPPLNYDALSTQNRDLRTRVSELEVINGLFRGRVGELESSEAEARRAAQRKEEEIERLRAERRGLEGEVEGLRKRVRELEGEGEEGRRRKMARVVAGGEGDGEGEGVKVSRVEGEGVKVSRVEGEGEGERIVGVGGRGGRSNFMMP
ncbi:GATA zinc finger protein 3 [Elasticomyces elasticus]|nr:GATA zinc finger protein 3 [Elasticomyces elasticus]KAK3667032.1 GATA zinc finger protein 3 [Elasticomyces elasticus]KAK4911709.1 GATA zinc finger protein 3 [Elasticomyces elasticus]KAK5751293.1 GATA zinc finger protein 3 [Elasticomyces elasticus]